MIKITDELLNTVHNHSVNNKKEIERSDTCGCFYCKELFVPTEINEWITDKSQTAVCSYCKVDSVIGNASGYEITKTLLDAMSKKWFGK